MLVQRAPTSSSLFIPLQTELVDTHTITADIRQDVPKLQVARILSNRSGSLSRNSTRTSDSDGPPLVVHPVTDSPDLLDLDAPACKRLISRSLSPQQIVSLIGAIFTSKDEVAMIRDLDGDDSQAFVDVVYEVRSVSCVLSEA